MIGTPITQPWLREFHVEWEKGSYPDTMFFKGTTEQNKDNLDKGYIESYSLHLTEKEKRTRLFGDFFSTDGLALAELFRRDKHLIQSFAMPTDYKSWPCVIALDPHPNKPTYACVLTAAPDGKKYYVAETARKTVPRDFGNWLKSGWLMEFNVVDIVCDSSGNADFTGGDGFKSFVEVLSSLGIRLRTTTYDEKKDDEFLTRLQEVLFVPPEGSPILQIVHNMLGIIRDIENVAWKPVKGTESYQPKLEISNTDYLACLKYALAANLTYGNAKRKIHRLSDRPNWMGSGKYGRKGRLERAWDANGSDDDDF
jgi:hypothetical protein